jgi:hypothetical protein
MSLTAAASAGELDRLAWLAGHWVTEDGAAEENWLEPRGGTMTGSFRWVFPNGNQVLEYLVIEEKDGVITFRFKHYNTDFEPWEKDEANTYRLRELTDSQIIFDLVSDNAKVPKVYRYTRTGDTLTFSGESSTGEPPLVLNFQRR